MLTRMKGKTLLTWGGAGETFCYEGSVKAGTIIHYGEGFRWTATISALDYQRLLRHFSSREVAIGTSKTAPPPGSVGQWMKANVHKTGLMSYVGAILLEEGIATKPGRGRIQF
jgi:hypothetical protein